MVRFQCSYNCLLVVVVLLVHSTALPVVDLSDDGWTESSRTIFPHVELDYPSRRRALQSALPVLPMRFSFDTRLIEERIGIHQETDAEIAEIIDSILPSAAARWAHHLAVLHVANGITLIPDACGPSYGDRLQQESLVFRDTDLIIQVSADDTPALCGNPTILAQARPCQLDQRDRPVVGIINFCLGRRVSAVAQATNLTDSDKLSQQLGTTLFPEHLAISLDDITLHEIGHLLGQTGALYKYFRDESGEPRTRRDATGLPIANLDGKCSNGAAAADELFPSEGTVQSFPRQDGGVEQFIVTPRVKSVVANLFDCPSAIGARLQESSACIGSHWHERHYFGNLLSPVISHSSENSLSVLALALLDDSGWYQVNYTDAVQPEFGLRAGCEFLQEDCIDSETGELADWVSNEFCTSQSMVDQEGTVTLFGSQGVFCDPTYRSWAVCDLFEVTDTPKQQYFPNPKLSAAAFDLADSCPVLALGIGMDCTKTVEYQAYYPGERVGSQSRCIDALHPAAFTDGETNRPACMEMECDETERVLKIGSDGLVCEFDGQRLAIPGRNGSYFICPRLAAVCPSLFACPSACSGRGECTLLNGKPNCKCDDQENTHPACEPERGVAVDDQGGTVEDPNIPDDRNNLDGTQTTDNDDDQTVDTSQAIQYTVWTGLLWIMAIRLVH